MKIHTLVVQRLKNVLQANFEFDSHINILSGENGAGKSTIVDAIFLAILGKTYIGKGKSVESLITEGSTESSIEIELRGERTLKIARKIEENGDVSLAIWSSDASKVLQADLNQLLSEFTIDPLDFTRKGSKEQYDAIKALAGPKVIELEAKIVEVFDKRKAIKILAEQAQAVADSLKDVEEVKTVSVQELLTEYAQSQAINKTSEEVNRKRAEKLERKNKIQLEMDALKKEWDDVNEYLVLNPEDKKIINTEDIQKQIAEAQTTHEKAAKYQSRLQAEKAAQERGKELEQANEVLEELRQKRKDLIKTSIDIEGIDFNERDGVVMNGRPLSTYSSAEQIIAACRIATHSNPLLKVISIKDGSLLDKANLEQLKTFAVEQDYQFFIERVGEEFDSIVLRNGAVLPKADEIQEKVTETPKKAEKVAKPLSKTKKARK